MMAWWIDIWIPTLMVPSWVAKMNNELALIVFVVVFTVMLN